MNNDKERNMSGMYKQLDAWIKAVIPVLPDSKLQDNLLHVLQVSLVLMNFELKDNYFYFLLKNWRAFCR